MESLRVPGTMVMDANNAGLRAPTMSRFEVLDGYFGLGVQKCIVAQTEPTGVSQLIMQCSNTKVRRQRTPQI